MRILKWISLGLAGLIVLALLGVLAIVWLVDPNSFKPRIEKAVKEATGRDFTLAGDIDLDFLPWLSLHTGDGRFGNAPGFGPDPLVSWHSAQLGAKLLPLLRGELVVDRVKLKGADLRLVRHADGTANWQGIGSTTPVDPNAPTRRVTVDGFDLSDSHLSFVDEGVSRRIEVADLNLATDEIAPDEPFTDTEVRGVLHMEGFASAGVPFRLKLPKVVLARDYSSVAAQEFALNFGSFEGEGGLSGTFGDKPKLVGAIGSNDFDPRELLRSVGIEAPKTTDAKAFGRVSFKASWLFDSGAIGIEPLSFTLDDTHFTGNFHRAAGEDPVGDFALRGDALNISRYIPPTDPASEPFVLPTAMLKSLKFRGVVELEQATLDDVVMKGVTLRLMLDEQGLRSQPPPPAPKP